MEVRSYSQTHIGLRRKTNQDAILNDPSIKLFAVADGMGGHQGGEVASSLSIKTLHEHIKSAIKLPNFDPEKSLLEGFYLANKVVFNKSRENENSLRGMGTTLVACLFWETTCFLANVGDSRMYLFQNPHLWRMTEDHSIIAHQIKRRLITEEQIPLLLDANVITRSVGFMPKVEVDLFKRKFETQDLFLLCSDGLHGMVEDEKISELCQKHSNEQLVNECIQLALDAGGTDNVSVVTVNL